MIMLLHLLLWFKHRGCLMKSWLWSWVKRRRKVSYVYSYTVIGSKKPWWILWLWWIHQVFCFTLSSFCISAQSAKLILGTNLSKIFNTVYVPCILTYQLFQFIAWAAKLVNFAILAASFHYKKLINIPEAIFFWCNSSIYSRTQILAEETILKRVQMSITLRS